jgi:hypothetical protein
MCMNDDQAWHKPWKNEETLSQMSRNRAEIRTVYQPYTNVEHYRCNCLSGESRNEEEAS